MGLKVYEWEYNKSSSLISTSAAVQISNGLNVTGNITSSGTITSTNSGESFMITNGTASTEAFYGAQRTDKSRHIAFGVGSGGTNAGIYDYNLERWIIYGTAAGATQIPSGLEVTGTLMLSRTQDAAGTANNKPALIVGGTDTTAHIEIDNNEIIAKSNGTAETTLYLGEKTAVNLAAGGISGGTFRPSSNNSLTLGTSSYKWSNVYATTFTGALSGNATTATTATTATKAKSGQSSSWYQARDNAVCGNTSYSTAGAYYPALVIKTTNGAWTLGCGTGSTNNILFAYVLDTDYKNGNNRNEAAYSLSTSGNFSGNAANVTGTVAVSHGGTGATNASKANYNLSSGECTALIYPALSSNTSATWSATQGYAGYLVAVKVGSNSCYELVYVPHNWADGSEIDAADESNYVVFKIVASSQTITKVRGTGIIYAVYGITPRG